MSRRPGTDSDERVVRLSERAYDRLRRGILNGEFPAGTVVSDGQVAEGLGMSKTPVRQALKLLAQEGLLETGRRRQPVVRGISPDQREEVLEIREALERIAVTHACRAMALDDVDQLRLSLFRQRRAAEAGDESTFIDLDEDFHLALARGAGLPTLERLLAQLRGFVRLMRLGTVRDEGHLFHVLAEHERIVDAVEQRDENAALAALTEHLHTSEYRISQNPGRE
jgi:GntR family transcriptional regulator, rspAB operon transcriptional repressor